MKLKLTLSVSNRFKKQRRLRAMLPRPEDLKLRKQLSAPGLLNIVRAEFHHVSEFRKRQPTYSMTELSDERTGSIFLQITFSA